MNKYFVILLLVLISCCDGFAQDGWILRNSGTKWNLNSIATFDGQNVVAVGDSGIVVTSSDAGVTWQVQKKITWISPFDGLYDTSLHGVSAMSGKIFCAVGPRDSVFRSTDGGLHWQGVRSRAKGNCKTLTDPFFQLKEMHAIDFDTSIKLCISVGDGGESIFSRDSGKHWFENLPNSLEHFTSVSSWGGRSLTSLTYGEAFLTTDKGDTWSTQWVQKNLGLYGSDIQGWTIVGENGAIYHSGNKGFTWDSIPSETQETLNAVRFGNIVRGHIVGNNGTILMTSDGGYSWQQQFCPTTKNLRGMCTFDFFHGFICGDSGVILTTQNGGYHDGVTVLPISGITLQNYPNPFSARTIFEFPLTRRGRITLKIFNVLGEEMSTIADGIFDPGPQVFEWDANSAPSGVYLSRLEMDGKVITSEVTLKK